jgi:hypothetical protein
MKLHVTLRKYEDDTFTELHNIAYMMELNKVYLFIENQDLNKKIPPYKFNKDEYSIFVCEDKE